VSRTRSLPSWQRCTSALRSPDERYRTTPLRGLFTRAKGGFYHDGRFAALADVVEHYSSAGIGNGGTPLGLSPAQKSDLIEYVKSL
jgi:cytochrome c peroxidase